MIGSWKCAPLFYPISVAGSRRYEFRNTKHVGRRLELKAQRLPLSMALLAGASLMLTMLIGVPPIRAQQLIDPIQTYRVEQLLDGTG